MGRGVRDCPEERFRSRTSFCANYAHCLKWPTSRLYGRSTDIDRAHAEGFVEHLTKPLDMDELLKIVRKLTNGPVPK